jgi:hypothetical protein
MKTHLVPSTLFNESKFEKYLVQVADFKEEEAKKIKEEEAKKNRPKPMTVEEMRGW